MLAIWRGEEDKTAKDAKHRQERYEPASLDMLSRVKRYVRIYCPMLEAY